MSLIQGTPTQQGLRIAGAIKKAYGLTGSTYRYYRSGSNYLIKGRLSIADFADYASRFTAAVTGTWGRPVYLLKIAGEFLPAGAPIVGDTVDIPASNRSSLGASEFITYTVAGIFYDVIGDVITVTRLYLKV